MRIFDGLKPHSYCADVATVHPDAGQPVYRDASGHIQGSKIVLVRSYLRVSQAAGQVNIFIFLLKIKFSPCMPVNFVMQGKCLFSDISRPAHFIKNKLRSHYGDGTPV